MLIIRTVQVRGYSEGNFRSKRLQSRFADTARGVISSSHKPFKDNIPPDPSADLSLGHLRVPDPYHISKPTSALPMAPSTSHKHTTARPSSLATSNPTSTSISTTTTSSSSSLSSTSNKTRQYAHLHSQLAQLNAHLADTENLVRMTAVQAQDVRFLGGYVGALFMGSAKVLGEESLGQGGGKETGDGDTKLSEAR